MQFRLFLVPYLVGTLILVVIPTLATVAVSLTKYNAVGIPKIIGLDNFRQMLTSAYVRIGLKNTAIFLVMAVPLRVIGALVLALLLQERRRFFGLYRAAVYLPTVIPEVAYALVWLWIFNPVYGPLSIVLGRLGLPSPEWLTDPATARVAIALMLSFQLGEGFVILLAGLQNIPRSFYEAAKVDGANSWQAFWRITLPLLTPWLLVLTFRDIIMSLQNTFTPTFVITYGGPYYATTFAPLLIYEIAFDLFDFGLAAAVLVTIYICLVMLVLGILNLVQGDENET